MKKFNLISLQKFSKNCKSLQIFQIFADFAIFCRFSRVENDPKSAKFAKKMQQQKCKNCSILFIISAAKKIIMFYIVIYIWIWELIPSPAAATVSFESRASSGGPHRERSQAISRRLEGRPR